MMQSTNIRPLSLASGLRSAAARAPTKTALIDGDRRVSFAHLRERFERVSTNAFLQLNLQAGDRVILIAPNRFEFIEIVVGLSQLGVATVTISPRQSPREISLIIKDCSPRAMFVDPDCILPHESLDFPVITIGEDYERWLSKNDPIPFETLVDENLPFAIPYTSGSTGQPKGVLLSQRTRLLTCYAAAGEYGCFSPDDHYLAVSPLYHGGGLVYALSCLLFGGTCALLRDFDPEQVLRHIALGAITGVFLVPTHFQQMLDVEPKSLESYRSPGNLKTIISNAAPLPDELRYRILDFWGEGLLHETYGSTEAGIVCNLRPDDQRRKKRCVGLPYPGVEIRVADEAGNEVSTGEIGELISRSPYNFSGYLGRPEETAAVQRDGWIMVGDLARRDEDGYIYVVGRKKDMVISGGLNIYPKEVEDVLAMHPAIAEVAVIGLNDSQWGETLAAAVVLREGMMTSSDELIAFCRDKLAGYKIPRKFAAFPSLPRSALGKIQKTSVVELMIASAVTKMTI